MSGFSLLVLSTHVTFLSLICAVTYGKNLPADFPIEEYVGILPPDACWNIPAMPAECKQHWVDFHNSVMSKDSLNDKERAKHKSLYEAALVLAKTLPAENFGTPVAPTK